MKRAAFALSALLVLSVPCNVYPQQQLIEDELQSKFNFVEWDDFIIYPHHHGVYVANLYRHIFWDNWVTPTPESWTHINCWGFAFGIMGGLNCRSNNPNHNGPWDWPEDFIGFLSFTDEKNVEQAINLNDFACNQSDATHILTWHLVQYGNDYVLSPMHGAIISLYEGFPYSEGWVVSHNSPLTHTPVICKLDDLLVNIPLVTFYDLRPLYGGQLPPNMLVMQPPIPTYGYAQNVGSISGPSTIPTQQTYHIFQVDPCNDLACNCEDIVYDWAAYDLRNKLYKVHPMDNSCGFGVSNPGTYILELTISKLGHELAHYQKVIQAVATNAIKVVPNPTTDQITIDLVDDKNGNGIGYVITNSFGTVVLQGSLLHTRQISLTSLLNGFYHISIYTQESVHSTSFVIQK